MKNLTVLIVEDDPEWRQALRGLYKHVLADGPVVVHAATHGVEAIDLLESQAYDLLSVDINLSRDHPRDATTGRPDLTVAGIDGTDVLEFAADRRACSAAIVVTSILANHEAAFVISDVERRRRMLMTPNAYLDRLFPGRSMVLYKDPSVSIGEAIAQYKEVLERVPLRQWIGGHRQSIELRPPYRILRDGRYTPARIWIGARGARETRVEVERDDYKIFVLSLIEATQRNRVLRDGDLESLFQGCRSVQVAVDGFRRDLRRMGVLDPDHLFLRVRKGHGHGGGWRLAPDVRIAGAASVSKRGRDPDTVASDGWEPLESEDQ